MPRQYRTAILKGYQLTIQYTDGSKTEQTYEPDELDTVISQITTVSRMMDAVDFYRVAKIWSKPGETVSLKVKQQGE